LIKYQIFQKTNKKYKIFQKTNESREADGEPGEIIGYETWEEQMK